MSRLTARPITLISEDKKYLRILGGPPGNPVLRSGMVVLQPGESVGAHCTDEYEELIITLEGQGEALVHGEDPFPIDLSVAVYVPPWTDHDIRNVGASELKYVYVVAKTTFTDGSSGG